MGEKALSSRARATPSAAPHPLSRRGARRERMFTSKKDKGATPSPQGKPGTPSKVVKPNYSRPVGLGDSPTEFFKWFKEADKDKDGFVNGNEAVAFFSRSRLPQPTLAKVWALSDKQRRGVLDLEDFVTSMKLISLAQSGKPISTEAARNIHKEGLAMPQLVGINISGSFEPA